MAVDKIYSRNGVSLGYLNGTYFIQLYGQKEWLEISASCYGSAMKFFERCYTPA